MKELFVFGYGYLGTKAAKIIMSNPRYKLCGFVDNSEYKKGNYAYGSRIIGINELVEVSKQRDVSVVIASEEYYSEIIEQCNSNGINIEGVYLNGRIKKYPWASFESLDLSKDIILYAGDIMDDVHLSKENLYGLSIATNDDKHILHDITRPYPLPDNCITSYESECVFELIGEENVINALNEIYRILKPGGLLRITVPDYYSPYLRMRSMKTHDGRILYDAGETYAIKYGKDGLVGGSIWFTNYDVMMEKLKKTRFSRYDWLCYYSEDGLLHKKNIDMSKGYNRRVGNNSDEDIYCIVVDCYK